MAQTNRYTVGVALTDAQIAELKTDIVWLVITGQGSTIDDRANQIATGATDPTTGKTPSRDATDADKAGGINLALSIGVMTQRNLLTLCSQSKRLSRCLHAQRLMRPTVVIEADPVANVWGLRRKSI